MNTVEAEYAIVGTGAAGPVLAYHLARAGYDVLMIERGPDIAPDEMNTSEVEMVGRLYKDGGAQMNTSCDMFVLQGNCVGGSTALTNGVCFPFPPDVLDRWESEDGLVLDRERLDAAEARVRSVLNVHELSRSLHNPGTPLLEAGIRAIGREPSYFEKNFLDCVGCGYCNVGCVHGRKLGSALTWVRMAQDRGARLLSLVEAMRLERSGRQVTGLLCRDVATGSKLTVRAKRYILSAGAINSPGLLLRSDITCGGAVGRWVSFNLGAICFAEFPEPIDAFDGDQMCVWLDERPSFVLEQLHNPPATFALTLPLWHRDHYEQLGRYRYMTSMGALVSSEPRGRVYHPRVSFWHEEIRFKASREELDRMRAGLETAARIFLAAGATRVIPPCAETLLIREESDIAGLKPRTMKQGQITGFGSSHPQGGCRMGTNGRGSVVNPEFRVRGLANLFVCDASVFPTSLGVNPQLPIMALADYAVTAIAGLDPPRRVEDGPAAEARRHRGLAPDEPVRLDASAFLSAGS